MVDSVPMDQTIIFAPDKNLGRYLVDQTGREMVLWDGSCIVHESFSIDKILDLKKQYPDSHIVAHPESEEHILKIAEYIGSTSGLLNYVKASGAKTFIVATESGILHQMQKENPDKHLIAAPMNEDSTCACNECPYMKLNTLEKLYLCMLNETPAIEIGEDLRIKALKPIERMLELSQ